VRTKAECLSLSPAELTLAEFSWCYPDLTCRDHYAAVHRALLYGYPVLPSYAEVYPSLVNLKPRKKREETHG
jgi:hypothetical protein